MAADSQVGSFVGKRSEPSSLQSIEASPPRLKIHELYVSIQGETSFAGIPCVFVRTTGCPLRCSWCDTQDAYYGGVNTTLDEVFARICAFNVNLVSITGGEPLVQQNTHLLMKRLCDAGHTVLLETSGFIDIALVDPRVHVIMDVKCPDSGEEHHNRWDNLPLLRSKDELKFVLASRRDYEFARELIRREKLADRCPLLFSTVLGAIEPKDVVSWMLADSIPARFQVQLHKVIWPADAEGV